MTVWSAKKVYTHDNVHTQRYVRLSYIYGSGSGCGMTTSGLEVYVVGSALSGGVLLSDDPPRAASDSWREMRISRREQRIGRERVGRGRLKSGRGGAVFTSCT